MLTRRLIVCLDVKDGRVVKGTRFEQLRDVGDPPAMAVQYEREGADELVFLDISATAEKRATLLAVVRRTAEQLFVPLTVGGGIGSTNDVMLALRSGADKVSLNSAAVTSPQLLTESADRFGSQCVVASIDAKRLENRWVVYTHGGSRPTELDAVEWALEVQRGLRPEDAEGSLPALSLRIAVHVGAAVSRSAARFPSTLPVRMERRASCSTAAGRKRSAGRQASHSAKVSPRPTSGISDTFRCSPGPSRRCCPWGSSRSITSPPASRRSPTGRRRAATDCAGPSAGPSRGPRTRS